MFTNVVHGTAAILRIIEATAKVVVMGAICVPVFFVLFVLVKALFFGGN